MKYWILFFLLAVSTSGTAQLRYTLASPQPNDRTFEVVLSFTLSDTLTELQFPVWRPGRYRIQDFAAGAYDFTLSGEAALRQVTPSRWLVRGEAGAEVRFSYRVLADNFDAGSSLLSRNEIYVNPINLLVYPRGREHETVSLEFLHLPKDWDVATSLTQPAPGRFVAGSYHELVDAPIVASPEIHHLQFSEGGVNFHAHFQGDYRGDAAVDSAYVQNVRKIVREQAALFGGDYPFSEYHFIYRLLPYNFRHAVEHQQSALFTLPAPVTRSVEALGGLYAITAHEFFHVWNVKLLRPAVLLPYDYGHLPASRLHWFTEGVTDYMAQLTLVRAGVTSPDRFYAWMADLLTRLHNDPANQTVAPAEASWRSRYESSPYQLSLLSASYYGLGARVALLLDARLAAGGHSLDTLFGYLSRTYGEARRGIPEDGVAQALEMITGQSWATFFAQYVDGTVPIDWQKELNSLGIEVAITDKTDDALASQGILRTRQAGNALELVYLHPQGSAAAQGLANGEIVISVNGEAATEAALRQALSRGDGVATLQLLNSSAAQPVYVQLGKDIRWQPQSITLEGKGSKSEWLRTRVR